jgi:hypothetical protein
MGNHEDLLHMFFKGHELFERWGNQWFISAQGGVATVRSLNPDSKIFDDMENLNNIIYSRGTFSKSKRFEKNRGEVNFDKKYMDFFNSLKYTHVEKISYGNKVRNILFSHSIPNLKIPINELLNANTFEEYHQLNDKYKIYIEKTSIWNRDELSYVNSDVDYLLVHGHTPTFLFDKYYTEQELKLSSDILLENVKEYGTPLYFCNKKTDRLVSINMDLGLVYNKSFGALFLPENKEEHDTFYDSNILYCYSNFSYGYRKCIVNTEFIKYGIERIFYE